MSRESTTEDYRDVLDPSQARNRRLRKAVAAIVLMAVLAVLVWRLDEGGNEDGVSAEHSPEQAADSPAGQDASVGGDETAGSGRSADQVLESLRARVTAPGEREEPESGADEVPLEVEVDSEPEQVALEQPSAPANGERAESAGREQARVRNEAEGAVLDERDAEGTDEADEAREEDDPAAREGAQDGEERTASSSAGQPTLVRLDGYGALAGAREKAQKLSQMEMTVQLFQRLRVGPFSSRGEADRAQQRLRETHGLDSMLTGGPSAGGRWYVQVGVFTDARNAEGLTERLSEDGFAVARAARIELGPFASREAAETALERAAASGVETGQAQFRDVR